MSWGTATALGVITGILLFGAFLWCMDSPNTANFIEIGDWRWQVDRRYLWQEGPPVDMEELDRLLDIAEPNDVIIIGEDGQPELR